VEQATRVQQQGTADAYQQALELLKQALQENPDNVAAVNLDAEVRRKLTSTALTALSPADSLKYKQALSLYISGAYQDAYDIVQGLWNDPRSQRNRTYDQLQKLKKRCEVALNIL
jgi:tetratricopeptide (TPR) repeat protein